MSTTSNPYRGFRSPAENINQAVWLYHRFSLSLHEVELIMAARGIVVSYEAIREWSLRFRLTYAGSLKRRRPKPSDKWFLDEVSVRIRGKLHHLWRAVDQHRIVLDVLLQSRRDKKVAKRFSRKLLKGLRYVPKVAVTDKLGCYGAAKREILPGVEHAEPPFEQSLRGLAPTHATTGTPHEAIQISPTGVAVSLYSHSDPQPLPTPPSSTFRQ